MTVNRRSFRAARFLSSATIDAYPSHCARNVHVAIGGDVLA